MSRVVPEERVSTRATRRRAQRAADSLTLSGLAHRTCPDGLLANSGAAGELWMHQASHLIADFGLLRGLCLRLCVRPPVLSRNTIVDIVQLASGRIEANRLDAPCTRWHLMRFRLREAQKSTSAPPTAASHGRQAEARKPAVSWSDPISEQHAAASARNSGSRSWESSLQIVRDRPTCRCSAHGDSRRLPRSC